VLSRLLQLALLISLCFGAVTTVFAADNSLEHAAVVSDPVTASRAEYGRIDRPGTIHLYKVKPSKTISVTLEAVVPVRDASADFRPAVVVVTPGASSVSPDLPFAIPAGYQAQIIAPDTATPRKTLFDPNSIERFYRNGSKSVSLPGGQTSYLAVYDPAGHTGDYVLGIASSPYYENASRKDLLAQGIALKFGAATGRSLPWTDVLGAMLAITGLVAAGIVAFGALLPRPRSQKRLRIWRLRATAGAFAALAGYYAGIRILNRDTGMIAVSSFQEILSLLLLLAAIWLMLQPADRPAKRYRLFVVLWSAGWMLQIWLLAWYLLVTRTT
jgi:hypothetical protein